jgi:hypothetical protein
MVHLLSYVPELRGKCQMVEEPVVLHNVKVAMRLAQKPERVYLAPDKTPLEFQTSGNYVEVTVPEINGYGMLVFE